MKIYIAGSITNNPDRKEQFEKAENYKNKFIELGETVQNFEEGMNGYELSQYNT